MNSPAARFALASFICWRCNHIQIHIETAKPAIRIRSCTPTAALIEELNSDFLIIRLQRREFSRHARGRRRDRTGWLATQSKSDRSPSPIPCQQGILQGISRTKAQLSRLYVNSLGNFNDLQRISLLIRTGNYFCRSVNSLSVSANLRR
jgi:hypothetical protein